jgi:hypothetical protein
MGFVGVDTDAWLAPAVFDAAVPTTADNGSLSLFQNTRIRTANHSPTATQIDPGRLALRSMRGFAQSRRRAQEPRCGPTIGA